MIIRLKIEISDSKIDHPGLKYENCLWKELERLKKKVDWKGGQKVVSVELPWHSNEFQTWIKKTKRY